ncbi:hypothetical protein X777_02002 [Ooceraea biroi]|uniref:GIY-YIG domain-containing protein n=1 Tax=Ooceraea biroi TaxID=2015173 RepID=A0A026WSC8_OOCBI|nr:hypothetical protein X777_02002 [Ooceraea biroi]
MNNGKVNVQVNRNRITLPYITNLSDIIVRTLERYKVDCIYTIFNRLDCIIKRGKDKLGDGNQTGVVYKIECSDCDACYIGQTKRCLETRIKEHRSNINRSENNTRSVNNIVTR